MPKNLDVKEVKPVNLGVQQSGGTVVTTETTYNSNSVTYNSSSQSYGGFAGDAGEKPVIQDFVIHG